MLVKWVGKPGSEQIENTFFLYIFFIVITPAIDYVSDRLIHVSISTSTFGHYIDIFLLKMVDIIEIYD